MPLVPLLRDGREIIRSSVLSACGESAETVSNQVAVINVFTSYEKGTWPTYKFQCPIVERGNHTHCQFF